jgi:hypothetical protein
MKKGITIFALVLIAISTGCRNNNADVKGKTIVFGNLEVAEKDFPDELSWEEANEVCAALGEGWRLPTADEIYFLYQNREEIGGFNMAGVYWTSSQSQGDGSTEIMYFSDGMEPHVLQQFDGIGTYNEIFDPPTNLVRAVKSL